MLSLHMESIDWTSAQFQDVCWWVQSTGISLPGYNQRWDFLRTEQPQLQYAAHQFSTIFSELEHPIMLDFALPDTTVLCVCVPSGSIVGNKGDPLTTSGCMERTTELLTNCGVIAGFYLITFQVSP